MSKDQIENLDQIVEELHQIALAIYRNPKTGNLYGKIEDWRTANSLNNKSIYAIHLSTLFYDENICEALNEEELREVLIEETTLNALASEEYRERERRILENQKSSKK